MTFSRRFSRASRFLLPLLIVLLITVTRFSQPADDPELKVLASGVGFGRIVSTDGRIDCGTPAPPTPATTNCRFGYGMGDPVTLQPSTGSTIAEWLGDCAGTPNTNPCMLTMSAPKSVRARFAPERVISLIPVFDTSTGMVSARTFGPADFLRSNEVIRPEDIKTYLAANNHVNTPARFLAALLPEFKKNWILMSRSESLQTGTAQSPRILLPSADGRFVFTIGMTESSSYPGSHPNAIEYMQWDADQKNFRFHEIVLAPIRDMGDTIMFPGDPTPTRIFPARPTTVGATNDVSIDDAKCHKCHSTRNVLNLDRTGPSPVPGSLAGTDIIPPGTPFPPGTVMAKNKPNWDTYDSWGGMIAFNRDRIYKGSIEAAAFRRIFNPWTWSGNRAIGTVLEQLLLQPGTVAPEDAITPITGGADDGEVRFFFDDTSPVTSEPTPAGSSTLVNYEFNRVASTSTGTSIVRGGQYVTLRHTSDLTSPHGENVEGRAVQLFDALGGADGSFNQQRIVDELIKHRIAPGSIPIDVRPVALAITTGCLTRANAATVARFGFFSNRNGGLTGGFTFDQMFDDTRARAQSIPRRKADLGGLNVNRIPFDRPIDIYYDLRSVTTPSGLLQEYGGRTMLATTGNQRLRQEVFQRPPGGGFDPDVVIGGFYVDRENYAVASGVRPTDGPVFNTEKLALYRYFLEPLGVSVDKWSMGVRGRSRTYSFADVFKFSPYVTTLRTALEQSLNDPRDRFPMLAGSPPYSCTDLLAAVDRSFSSLRADGSGEVPTYTDVQRIFNKSCVECHGGLLYPPYRNFVDFSPMDHPFGPDDHLDLSEEEYPTRGGRRRMLRSYENAVRRLSTPPESSQIYRRITDPRGERCPYGLMPCGGPALSQADIKIILRWIAGYSGMYSEGDPHIRTLDGVDYDFQSAGEFVLLRGEGVEIQVRQIPVDTGSPLGPNEYTGLSSCVSVNGAVAIRIGGHRITYQPDNNEQPEASRLQLRIDGKLSTLTAQGIPVDSGVRIMQSPAPGGIRIESPGGTAINLTPAQWWAGWFININITRARATEGIMGPIAPGSWLPALPDGSSVGPMPTTTDLRQRYVDLYEEFEAAWRVTDATTLFDYAPGLSTRTFTLEAWPIENPQTCQVPRRVTGPPPKPPLAALPLEAAQQACAGIVAANRKTNCIKDVMVTGDIKFANGYLLSEQIERNGSPNAPALNSPTDYADDLTELALPINFSWNSSNDPNGDAVTYRHCVWALGQRPDNNKCEPTAVTATSSRKTILWVALMFLLLCLLLLLFVIFVKKYKKPLVLVPMVVVVVALVFVAIYLRRARSNSATLDKTVVELKSGTEYFWKVIAEDGRGGIAESETRRIKTK